MSGIQLAWVATITVGNQTAKQLLQFYAGHHFGKPGFEFKNSTLAKQLEVSERAIQLAHKLLLEKNFLIKEARYNKEGRQLTNTFYLNIPKSFVDNFLGEGERTSPLGVNVVRGEGERTSPLLNNNINNKLNNNMDSKKNELKNNVPLKNATVLPTWLDKEDWQDFKEHRKQLKKPLNENAEKRALTKLTKLKESGHNVKEIINDSIINGWSGFFEPKKQNFKPNGNSEIRSTVSWYTDNH